MPIPVQTDPATYGVPVEADTLVDILLEGGVLIQVYGTFDEVARLIGAAVIAGAVAVDLYLSSPLPGMQGRGIPGAIFLDKILLITQERKIGHDAPNVVAEPDGSLHANWNDIDIMRMAALASEPHDRSLIGENAPKLKPKPKAKRRKK